MQKHKKVVTAKDLQYKKDLPVSTTVSLLILLCYITVMGIYYNQYYLDSEPVVTVFIYCVYPILFCSALIIHVITQQRKIDEYNTSVMNLGNIYINMGSWGSLERSASNEIYRH